MKKLLIVFLALSSLNSFANSDVEPGPVQQMSTNAVETMDALLRAKSADLAKFIKAGNTITTATLQRLDPSRNSYEFTRQQCMKGGITGGICLGGAKLQVTTEEVRSGSQVIVKSSSRVVYIR